MSDVQEAETIELENPTIDVEEPVDPGAVADADDDALASVSDPADPLETIEFEGKQYQIPAALKEGFILRSDYTRKTQELADQRRGLEGVENNLRQQAQATDDEMRSRATLLAIDTALQNFAQTNWDQLLSEDPIGAQQQWIRYQQLKEHHGQVVNDLQQRVNARSQDAYRETVQRFEETQQFAKQHIKGWTPELDLQIVEFAKSKGATDQNLRDSMSPLVYNLLYLARIGEQALSKTAAPRTPAGQPARPLSMVGGKSNPSAGKSLHEMSMEEYAEHRQAQMAKGR